MAVHVYAFLMGSRHLELDGWWCFFVWIVDLAFIGFVFDLCSCPNLSDYGPAEWWFVFSLGHAVDI